MELLGNRASTKAKIQHYDTTKDQITLQKNTLETRLQEITEGIKKQEADLSKDREELEQITQEIAGYTEEIEEKEQHIAQLQDVLSEKQEKFRIGQTAYHRAYSRLESLKNITERYDGYGKSIRNVMANKEKERGLLGVVADIIQVDKKYETAVETALGGNIQNIVTEDEVTAKMCIRDSCRFVKHMLHPKQ